MIKRSRNYPTTKRGNHNCECLLVDEWDAGSDYHANCNTYFIGDTNSFGQSNQNAAVLTGYKPSTGR